MSAGGNPDDVVTTLVGRTELHKSVGPVQVLAFYAFLGRGGYPFLATRYR